MDSVKFAILLIVKLVEAELLIKQYHARHASEAKSSIFISKDSE